MSQIGKLYDAFCKEQEYAEITPEEERLNELLSEMLPHKEYETVEQLLMKIEQRSDEKYFYAGFRAATKLWTEAMK